MIIDKLANQCWDILCGKTSPDHGFYISLAADGVIIICSLVRQLPGRATKAAQFFPAATNEPTETPPIS